MAAFGGLIITNRGRALQAKAQIGTQLVFTRIAVGDGDLGGSSILDLTALKHEVKSLPITKIKTLSGGKAVLGAILSNQDITQGFYLREIGVFAQDPDLGEILYCYGNAGALAEYIPAGGGPDIVEKNIDLITIVGNASSVSAVIDESLIFETPAGAQEKADTAEANAKAYADQQVATRVLNAGNTPSIQAGLDAEKPAPGTAGRLYVATDTQIIYRDTGTAWAKVGVVKWGDIEGKPASFTPAAHTHPGSDVTSKVASASAADAVPWSGVTGKPSSFTPSAHKSTHASGGSDALTPADIKAVRNDWNVPSIRADSEINRPLPGTEPGRIFIATDTQRIYRDNGSAWVLVGVVNWGDVANKPSSFPPSAHKSTHATGGADALVPGDIGAASAADLAAHLAETVLEANKTINVPTDYPTVQAALDSLKYTWIPKGVTVTIQVAAGTYTHTSPIEIDHPCGSRIQIIGASPVVTTITGVGSISGSAGNWSVPINVTNSTGMAVGDYAIIRNTTGTGDHFAHRGIWEIIGISGNTVTVKNTHRANAFPTHTLTGGDFVCLKTILKFNSCDGIVSCHANLGLLDSVAIVGNGISGYSGIIAGSSKSFPSNASITCGSNVGVNGFGSDGFVAQFSSSILADYGVASGNGSGGFVADYLGSIIACSGIASGNGIQGFSAFGGNIAAPSSTASGNLHSGYFAVLGSCYVNNAVATGNVGYGFYSLNSSGISASYSTASGNGTDYKVEKMGYILCNGYTGSPTFSPALNTVGNYNAIITT